MVNRWNHWTVAKSTYVSATRQRLFFDLLHKHTQLFHTTPTAHTNKHTSTHSPPTHYLQITIQASLHHPLTATYCSHIYPWNKHIKLINSRMCLTDLVYNRIRKIFMLTFRLGINRKTDISFSFIPSGFGK